MCADGLPRLLKPRHVRLYKGMRASSGVAGLALNNLADHPGAVELVEEAIIEVITPKHHFLLPLAERALLVRGTHELTKDSWKSHVDFLVDTGTGTSSSKKRPQFTREDFFL